MADDADELVDLLRRARALLMEVKADSHDQWAQIVKLVVDINDVLPPDEEGDL